MSMELDMVAQLYADEVAEHAKDNETHADEMREAKAALAAAQMQAHQLHAEKVVALAQLRVALSRR